MPALPLTGSARALNSDIPRAEYNLAVCYASGHGVDKDPAEAVKWFRKAAEQGDPNAQYNLAVCYAHRQRHAQGPGRRGRVASQGRRAG